MQYSASPLLTYYVHVSKLLDSSKELDSETDSKKCLPLEMTSVLLWKTHVCLFTLLLKHEVNNSSTYVSV